MNNNTISSIKDERILLARSLTSSKQRILLGRILLYDEQHISWALHASLRIEFILQVSAFKDVELAEQCKQLSIPMFAISQGIMKKVTGTNYVVPVVAVAQCLDQTVTDQDFVLVLDNLQDHGNIGAILRTASAFDVASVALTNQDIDLFYRKTIDASRGKVFSTQMMRFDSDIACVEALQRKGFQVIATSPYGATIQSLTQLRKKPIALVVGNESDGSRKEVLDKADYRIQIPMSGDVESLNVAVAAGISLYELKIKMVLTMLTEKIKNTLGRNIGVALQLIQKAFDAQLSAVTEFSSKQVIALMICKCDGTTTMQQLAKDMNLLERDMPDFLQPLFANEFIDNNQEILSLTYKGEEYLAKIWTVVERSEKDILAGFSDQEKAAFFSMLGRLHENCAAIMQNKE